MLYVNLFFLKLWTDLAFLKSPLKRLARLLYEWINELVRKFKMFLKMVLHKSVVTVTLIDFCCFSKPFLVRESVVVSRTSPSHSVEWKQ